MIRKLLLMSVSCLFAASAAHAGACHGQACLYAYFGKDAKGCLEIRNSGREAIEVTVFTTKSVPTMVRVASGDTEKVYKSGRVCIPAADYVRAEAAFAGGVFGPSR